MSRIEIRFNIIDLEAQEKDDEHTKNTALGHKEYAGEVSSDPISGFQERAAASPKAASTPEGIGTSCERDAASKETSEIRSIDNKVVQDSTCIEEPLSDCMSMPKPREQEKRKPSKTNSTLELSQNELAPVPVRRRSFIRPNQSQTMRESVRYAIESVMWILYQSSILSFIPSILIFLMFGSVWFFDMDIDKFIIYHIGVITVLNTTTYATIALLTMYIFGRPIVVPLIKKYAIPFCLMHNVLFAFRDTYSIWSISVGYYSMFITFCFIFLRKVASKEPSPEEEGNETKSRYRILASDGTPMALFKGFILFYFLYYISTFFLLPYFMDSGFLVRLFGRIIVVPGLFHISDAYMSNLIMYKSKEHLKYRMVFGNIMMFISSAMNRLIVVNSSDVRGTTMMAMCSSMFDSILWVTHIPRAIYASKIAKFVENKQILHILSSRKVDNFNAVHIQGAQEISGPREGDNPATNSVNRLGKFWILFNQEDDRTDYVRAHRANRSFYLLMCDIQFIIYLPTILYLLYPARDYLTVQPFTNFGDALASVLIQLPIELFSQILSLSIDNYMFGTQINVPKALSHNLTVFALVQSTLISITVALNSINPFWISREEWPNK